MKLKNIYGLVFGLFGAVFASLVGYSAVYIFFWLCVRVFSLDVSCDIWKSTIFPAVFISVFLIYQVKAIIAGLKYGSDQDDDQDKTEALAKAKRWLLFALIFLFIAISVFINIVSKMRKEIKLKNEQYSELSSRVKINSFNLMTTGSNAVGVRVGVEGVKNNKCELALSLFSYGHVTEKLLEVKGDFSLNNEKQEKSFFVPFTDIAKNYHRVILKDIPAFNENKHMEEYIIFEVRLRLLGTERYNKDTITKVNPKEEVKSGAARFMFSCTREQCKVVQEEKN